MQVFVYIIAFFAMSISENHNHSRGQLSKLTLKRVILPSPPVKQTDENKVFQPVRIFVPQQYPIQKKVPLLVKYTVRKDKLNEEPFFESQIAMVPVQLTNSPNYMHVEPNEETSPSEEGSRLPASPLFEAISNRDKLNFTKLFPLEKLSSLAITSLIDRQYKIKKSGASVKDPARFNTVRTPSAVPLEDFDAMVPTSGTVYVGNHAVNMLKVTYDNPLKLNSISRLDPRDATVFQKVPEIEKHSNQPLIDMLDKEVIEKYPIDTDIDDVEEHEEMTNE